MARQQPGIDDPIADLLINHAYLEVASALRCKSDAVIMEWEDAVLQLLPAERKLSETQLRDHLPQVLKLLADLLGEDDPSEMNRLLQSPIEHGTTRFQQHYNTGQFIIEYRLLRRVLVTQVEKKLKRRLATEEDLALDMAIDLMLQRGVIAFVQHQEERLQAATEGEKKYLSFLSHDLRNNLNAVIMELEVLKRRLANSAEFVDAVEDLDFAQQSVFETVDGMDRLLQTERLRKRADPIVTPVDLHGVITEVVRRSRKRAADKGLELAVEVEAGAIIHSDRELLKLALLNLVGNAVKFSSNGTVGVRCLRGQTDNIASWKISVADQGPGIAPERLNDLFTMFSRGETHGQAGMGLGLAVVSQAARRLGAKLTLDSRVGVGSTFELTVPESWQKPEA